MPVFWGCTFTHNYPFLIKSTKALLDSLGVEPAEVKEFGCCPDPIYIRAYGKESSLCLSARNLALAQRHGKRLLVACNGCYNVLHGAQEELENPMTRAEINSTLPQGTKYNGGLQVVHLLNLLNAKNPIIKSLVKKPLKGIKVAVHYGCHAIYPPAVSSDDPRDPRSMDDLVTVTGATSVDYESKVDCCGIPVISFDKEEGDAMLLKKLADIKKAGADCVVTACPACFMRFDMLPPELKEYEEKSLCN